VTACLNSQRGRYAMTSDSTVVPLRQPDVVDDPLTAVLREGARRLLAQAVEAEAEAFLASMRDARLPDGRDRIVRHGHGPERVIQTAIGPVAVRRVKLRDRDGGESGERVRFTDPIESVFATVRHRTVRTRGALSQDTARLMVFKLIMAAAKTWRRLKGENQLPKVVVASRSEMASK
jgi:hypothetical protein